MLFLSVEVAARRPTVQSTTMGYCDSSRAVDGNTNGNWSYKSCSQTSLQENPWWQVDLGTRKTVTEVAVFNCEDWCSSNYLSNMEIRIGKVINCGNWFLDKSRIFRFFFALLHGIKLIVHGQN